MRLLSSPHIIIMSSTKPDDNCSEHTLALNIPPGPGIVGVRLIDRSVGVSRGYCSKLTEIKYCEIYHAGCGTIVI